MKYKKVLWIDPTVRDYHVFVNSVNEDTLALVYPEPLLFQVERIGFVFEKHTPMANYLQENADLLIGLGAKTMDFLACDTLPEWQSYYDKLIGVRVGASNHNIGNPQYGGDWLMETTCENVEKIYFTQSIQNYKHLLGYHSHTVVFDNSGNLWGCGTNTHGQLGNGNTNSPVKNFTFMRSNISSFACGYYCTIALDHSGNLWGCGRNTHGQLGLGNTNNMSKFTFMRSNISSFAYGDYVIYSHILALDHSGNLWGCGTNSAGQLGLGNFTNVENFSFRRSNISNISSLACGAMHTLALDRSGNLWGCGSSFYGQLGKGNTNNMSKFTFMRSNIKSFACGQEYTVALDHSGNLWGCGYNKYGELGLGNFNREVKNFSFMRSNISSFACGANHTVALDQSGNLWGCGRNTNGPLGLGNNVGNNASCKNFSFMRSNIAYVTCGGAHTFALDYSGNLWGCGSNSGGQFGLGNTNTTVKDFTLLRSNVYTMNNNLHFAPIPEPIIPAQITKITQKLNDLLLLLEGTGLSGGSLFYSSTIQLTNPITPEITVPTTYSDLIYTKETVPSNQISFTAYPVNNFGSNLPSYSSLSFTVDCSYSYDGIIVEFVGVTPSPYPSIQRKEDSTGFFIVMDASVPSSTYQLNVRSPNSVCTLTRDIVYTQPPHITSITQTRNTLNYTAEGIELVGGFFYAGEVEFINPISPISVPTTYLIRYKNNAGIFSNEISFTVYPLFTYGPTVDYNTLVFVIECSNAYNGVFMSFIGDNIPSPLPSIQRKLDSTGFEIIMDPKVPSGTYRFNVRSHSENATTRKNLDLNYTQPEVTTLLSVSQIPNTNTLVCTTMQYSGMYKVYLNRELLVSSTINPFSIPSVNVTTSYTITYDVPLIRCNVLPFTFYPLIVLTSSTQNRLIVTFIGTGIEPTNTVRLERVNQSEIETVSSDFYTIQKESGRCVLQMDPSMESRNTDSIKYRFHVFNGNNFTSRDFHYAQPITITNVTNPPNTNTIQWTGFNLNNVTYSLRIITSTTYQSIQVAPDSLTYAMGTLGEGTYMLRANYATLTAESPPFQYTPIPTLNTPTQPPNSTSIVWSGTSLSQATYYLRSTSQELYSTIPFAIQVLTQTMGQLPSGTYRLKAERIGYYTLETEPFSYVIPPIITEVHFSGNRITYSGSNLTEGSVEIKQDSSIISTRILDSLTNSFDMNIPGGYYTLYFRMSHDITYSNFSYYTLDSISPVTSVVNAPITLYGSNLSNLSYASFGGKNISFLYKSTNEIRVFAPESTQSTCEIGIWDIYGNNSSASIFTYAPLFSVSTFSPAFAVQRSPLVLTGSNFSQLDTVEFGNTSTRQFTYTSNQIELAIPDIQFAIPESTETGCEIRVCDLFGNRSTYENTFYYEVPSIYEENGAYLEPTSKDLTLYGEYLINSSYVTIGGQPYPVRQEENTYNSVVLSVPPGGGTVPIMVYDYYDTPTNSLNFTFQNISAQKVTPGQGTRNWPITVEGEHLINTTKIFMGGVELPVNSLSIDNERIIFLAPPGEGNASIRLVDGYGNESQITAFEYQNPIITGFNTSRGRTRLLLKIYGQYLQNTSYVLFGGQRNRDAIQYGDGYIEAVVPETYGNVSVEVVDRYENHTPAPDPFFCLGGNASIYYVSPTRGTRNTSVTVFGENLEFSEVVHFKNEVASLNQITSSFLNVSAPKGNGMINIVVEDILDKLEYSYGAFTYENPLVSEMFPSTGPEGTVVKLTGEFLQTTQFLYFGDKSLSCVSSPTEVSFVVPPGSENTSVYLIDHLGNVTESPTLFTYRNPRIDSITPSRGPPGMPVTLTGHYLENSSFLRINSSIPILSRNVSTVTATIPDGSGTVVVQLLDRYLNPATTSFTYNLPRLTQIHPSTGPPRQSVTLSGEFLANTSYVMFGTTRASNLSGTEEWKVDVPDGSGNVSVTVFDIYNNPARYDYTYETPYARSMPLADVSGATVILEGDFLDNTSTLQFGPYPVTQFSYGNGSLAIRVPPGAGNVSVTAYDKYLNPATIPSFDFLYPQLRTITPSTGPQRQSVLFEGETLFNTSAIYFGLVPADFENVNGNLSVKVPDVSNEIGSIQVTVYDSYGNATYGSYGYENPRSQTLNLSGVIGSTVYLAGDFLENTSTIQFGPYPVTQFSYARMEPYMNGSLAITVPPGMGNVSITAYDKYLNPAIVDSFDYLFPTILSVDPPSGPTGQPIRLIGEHLENTSYLVFEDPTQDLYTREFTYAEGVIQVSPLLYGNTSITAYDLYGNPARNSYVIQNPEITALSAYAGAIGSTVIFTGISLSNTSYIYFGPNLVESFSRVEGTLHVIVPKGTGSVPITAYDLYDNPTTIYPFVYQIPTLTGTYVGPQRQTIFLEGDHLQNTVRVQFGNLSFPASYPEIVVPDGTGDSQGNVSMIVYDRYHNAAYSNYQYQNPTATSMNIYASVIGNTVLFSGLYLEKTTRVEFGPYNTSFFYVNGNLSIKVPPGEGNVSITAYDRYDNPATIYSFDYLFPKIEAITPSTGPQKQYVRLTGDYLSDTSVVKFNGIPSTEVYWGNGSVRVKVPEGTGPATVMAYDRYDNSTSIQYTYLNPRQDRLLFQGAAKNWPLTVEGDHLENVSKVRFLQDTETLYLDPVSISKEKVTVILPPGDTTAQVSILDVYGNETLPQVFEYRNPRLERLSNLSGRTNLYMTLTGTHLQYTQEVLFGDKPQLGTLTNNVFDTRVQVVVPEVYGVVSVRILDACGNETSLPFFSLGGNASIQRLEPNEGPNGITMNIVGENLGFTKQVTLGGLDAEIQYPFNASRISVIVPSVQGNTLEVNALVYDILDESIMFYGKYTYKNPALFNVSFSEGTTSTPVVIQGIHLGGTTEVQFGDNSIPFEPYDTELRIRAPPGEGITTILVKNAYESHLPILFTYQNPSVSVIDRFGATGSRVHFSGEYLGNTSVIYFNSSAFPADPGPSVRVPPGTENASLVLEDRYWNRLKAGSFVYQNPTLFALDPAEGLRNTMLNLSGLYLDNLSYVQFGSERVIPSGLQVRIPLGYDTVSVYAVDLYDNKTEPRTFTYITPEITSLEPRQGPTGSHLNLSGKYLRNVSYVQVGETRLYDFSYVDTGIQVVIPPGTGNVSVLFESTYENVYDSPVQFTYANPDVVSVEPLRGPARQTVTLRGSHLQNTSRVVFRREETERVATIVSRNTSSVQVRVPEFSGIADIVVIDLYGNASSTRYEYQNPLITNISPLNGGLLDRLVITGVFLENTSTIRMIRPVPFTRDPLTITVVNGRGRVPIVLEDTFGNVTTFPRLFQYTYTELPQVDILPYYAKPGDRIRVNLPDALFAMGKVEYVNFGTQQVPVMYETYVEVLVPDTEFETIELLDASFEVIATNGTFEFETIRVSRIYPLEGFPGDTLLIEGDFTPQSQVYFGILPYGDLDPSYLGTIEYIHAHALLVTIPDVGYEGKITVLDAGTGFQGRALGTSDPFLIKHPRFDSTSFGTETVEITGLYLSNLRSILFDTIKTEVTGSDTRLSARIPRGYGSVLVSAVDQTGKEYPLDYYTYPVEIPLVVRTGGVRCLAVGQRLYFTNDRTIYNEQEVVYVHTHPITALAVQTELYFCDGTAKIYRYHPRMRRYLPPYGLVEAPKSLKIHQMILYALLTDALWTFNLLTEEQVTYAIEPSNGMAFDGTTLYLTQTDGVYTSSITGGESQLLVDLSNPQEIAVQNGHLFVSGSILHYTLDPITLVNEYETTDQYTSFAWSGQTLYLSNTTQSQIETLTLPSDTLRLDTMTARGTENAPFELTGEGLEQVSAILIDHKPIQDFQVESTRRITGRIPKGHNPTWDSDAGPIEILNLAYERIPHRFTFAYENTQLYACCPTQAFEHEPITLLGEYLDRVIRVYMGGVPVEFVNTQPNHSSSSTQLRVADPLPGNLLLIDRYFNQIQSTVTFSQLTLESNICFRSGTIVHTDQGPIEIQKLKMGHTVFGKEIKGLTETYYSEDQLVCVQAHAFRPDYPYRETVLSKRHKIWIQGRMVEAQALMGHPGVTWTPYRDEKLYNVLLDEEGRMNVQGIICETLDPSNPMAHRFRWAIT